MNKKELEIKEKLHPSRSLSTLFFDDISKRLKNISLLSLQSNPLDKKTNMDKLEIVRKSLVKWFSDTITLDHFEHFIPTSGATEAIGQWLLNESRNIQIFPGEYPWISKIRKVSIINSIDELCPNKVLYLSIPFSSNGNYPRFLLRDIKTPIVVDLALMPTAKKQSITLPHSTEQVFISFSKYLGIPSLRVGGRFYKHQDCFNELVQFSYYSQTLHSVLNLIIEKKIGYYYNRFQSYQESLCVNTSLEKSDTVFIANSSDETFSHWVRSDGNYRLNLSHSLAEIIRANEGGVNLFKEY